MEQILPTETNNPPRLFPDGIHRQRISELSSENTKCQARKQKISFPSCIYSLAKHDKERNPGPPALEAVTNVY